MTLSIKVAENMDTVRDILRDPYIWERASDGNVLMDTYEPTTSSSNVWLLVNDFDRNIGIILMHTESNTAIRIHTYLLEGHVKSSRNMMIELYRWVIKNIKPSIEKINVTIPMFNRMMYNLAKKVGFVDEGVNRHSYRKDGEVFDQWNLGITTKEINEVLERWAV